MFRSQWIGLATLIALSQSVVAQENTVKAHKFEVAPVIDGVVGDDEWKDVPSFSGLHDATTGQPANQSGTFWLAYDKDHIYFAARLTDSSPGAIRATEYRTNVSLSADDNVSISLDLSGSLASANTFSINPRGATQIALEGGRADKREWGGEFVGKGRITDSGWEAEARIPWQVMRLPGAGPRTVRFNVQRFLARDLRSFEWAKTGNGATRQNMGRWEGVELPKQKVDRKIQLLPYLNLGRDPDTGFIGNSGLDLKTNISDQIAMVGSVNPDFRNIENQILSLDVSRFERIAGESRPFFLEGLQYYNTAIYASQRIQKFDVGANVYGKLSDKISFGALNAVDFGGNNNFATNITYDPNASDSLRASFTSLNGPTVKNDAYLVRYFKTMGAWSLFLRNMGSQDSVFSGGQSNTINVNYQKGFWNGFASWDNASANFLPRLGFQPERDYSGVSAGFGFDRSFDKGPISNFNYFLFWSDQDRFDGGHYRKTFNPNLNLALRNSVRISTFASWDEFFGQEDKLYGMLVTYPSGSSVNRVTVQQEWGEIAGESYRSNRISVGLRPVKQLQLTASYQKVKYFNDSDQAIIGMNYDLGNDFYLSGRAVKRDRDWNAYLSFRRSGNRGVEHYLILGDPNAQRFRPTIILKVVVPIDLKF